MKKITIILTLAIVSTVLLTSCGQTTPKVSKNNSHVNHKVSAKPKVPEFEKLLTGLMKEQMKNIPKPPSELKLEKDQYETTAEFNARVEKTKKNQASIVAKYKRDYALEKQKAQQRAMKEALRYTWGKPLLSNLKYDADNGYFVADIKFENKKSFSKKVAIKVPKSNARSFGQSSSSLKPQAVFDYDGSSVKLKDIRVPFDNTTYLAQFTDMSIDDTRVAVNITNDIQVDTSVNTKVTVAQSEVSSFDASKLKSFNDLDKLLAKAPQAKRDSTKWLFVVGIEQYEFTDNISYAKRSAEMFTKTAQKRLGIPKENSYVLIDSKASQAHIKTSMKKMLRRVKSGDSIYFYYNGHGVPVPSQKNEPYMLTYDTEPDFVQDENFFSLQNIYSKLSDSKAAKVVAVVDSCFSSVTDGKSVLKGVAATKMVAKRTKFDKEKMVVLSAGKGNQYSNAYNKKGHRLFSFYVMKNMLEGDKDIKTLYKDTKAQTYETSIQEYGDGRTQEPTIDGNFRLSL
ncbi:caspase family protein [Sulfurimonas sp.]|nr:caspase family protein [Sulfurimonas sp.]